MKTLGLVIVLLLFAFPCHAEDITFAWDASPDPVDGYRLYYSKQSGVYEYGPSSPNMLWEGTGLTATVTVTKCGQHYFVATAYCFDDNAVEFESGPSNEESHVVKPHVNNLRK